MVHTVTLKELRPSLPKVVDKIERKMDRYVVSRHGKPVAVMMSVEDYESLMETLDLLEDPSAMEGLRKGEEDLRKGRTVSWKKLKGALGVSSRALPAG